jgi:arylsulfatase A-like enzyme
MTRGALRRPRPRLLVVLLLAPLAACGDRTPAPGPAFVRLAHEGAPAAERSRDAVRVATREAPEGWVRALQVVPPEAWTAGRWPGVYSTLLTLPGSGTVPGRDAPHELRSGGDELTQLPVSNALLDPATLADGSFFVMGDELLLLDRERRYVERDVEYYAWIEHGFREDGRVHLPGVTGEGFLLLPGERVDVELPAVGDAGAVMQFTAMAYGSARNGAATTVEVLVDGEVVRTLALENQLLPAGRFERIPLPAFRGGRLTLSASEGDGLALLLAPLLASEDFVAHRNERRPDLVLFLADTFRADNLEPWGGDPGLAPVMNAFARESQVFLGAHSPAPWTLPSQASMLTGVYPLQLGLTGEARALGEEVPALAATLADAGYRTVAVTDGLLVSERYGIDRGFEAFFEEHLDRGFDESTLARTRRVLDADDGRPLFLFVQTYRVHTPYRASLETLRGHPELFGADPDPAEWDYYALKPQLAQAQRDFVAGDESGYAAAMDRMRRLYLGGVADLDRGFARFLDMLGGAGLGDAFVLLTSDHGEAFGEHDAWTHGSSVFEEQIRVPFVLRGPGLGTGVHEHPVSLVDVPPTLTALVGIGRDPLWVGRELFAEHDGELCVFSFECQRTKQPGDPDDYSLFTGRRKVIGHVEDGRTVSGVVHAFDLHDDPDEALDLSATQETWPADLMRRWTQRIDEVTSPDLPSKPLVLSETEREALRAMGYLGD